MMGTVNCVYETPCGWCSKWDKECDKKIAGRGNRVKCNPVDDAVGDSFTEILINKACKSELDHEWECCGIGTGGTTYRCKKCYATKIYPYKTNGEISITM